MTTLRSGERVPASPPPRLPFPVVLHQSWRDVVFVHWAVAPEAVATLYPPGTQPDTWCGLTYVGLVGFAVPRTTLPGGLPVGGTYEVNVRLYSRDRSGRQGVVFRSMDVTRPDMVVAARLLPRLPYMWARVEPVRRSPSVCGYRVHRRFPRWLTGRIEVDVDARPVRGTRLERFCTTRWGLHTRTGSMTAWIPVAHRPWPLYRGRLRHADVDFVVAAGVPPPDGEPVSVLWSPGVDADVGRPVIA